MKVTTDGQNPLVSIVIPTYNHAEFLRKAIESVISQTYCNWEIIIIDNYSNDHTIEVVESFENPKINLLKIHNNGVIAVSRNLGINHANGKWIAFMDSDDVWYPNRLSVCAKIFEADNNVLDVISTDEVMVFCDSDKQKTLYHGPASENMYKDMLLYGNRLSPSATLVKQSFLVLHNLRFSEDHEFITVEDYDFWMRLATCGAVFFFERSVQGEYRIHSHNESSQTDKHYIANFKLLKKHVFELQGFDPNRDALWKKIKARVYFSEAIKQGLFMKKLKLFYLSISSSPLWLCWLLWFKLKLSLRF